MRLIRPDQLPCPPYSCAVFPQQNKDAEGFIDTQNELTGWHDRVYISGAGQRAMNRERGWPSPEEHDEALERIAALTAELERERSEREGLQERFDAIDVLASADFVARKKPGRKASEKAVA